MNKLQLVTSIDQEIRVVFIADPQLGPYKQETYLNKIISKTLEQKPDIVLLGGDLVNNGIPKTDETHYLEPLYELANTVPTYAVFGNHEYAIDTGSPYEKNKSLSIEQTKEVRDKLESLGIVLMTNDLKLIEVNSNHNDESNDF